MKRVSNSGWLGEDPLEVQKYSIVCSTWVDIKQKELTIFQQESKTQEAVFRRIYQTHVGDEV